MNYINVINLILAFGLVILSFYKFKQTSAKAFLFLSFAYVMMSISWFSLIMGWDTDFMQTVLLGERISGYLLIIIGLLI